MTRQPPLPLRHTCKRGSFIIGRLKDDVVDITLMHIILFTCYLKTSCDHTTQ